MYAVLVLDEEHLAQVRVLGRALELGEAAVHAGVSASRVLAALVLRLYLSRAITATIADTSWRKLRTLAALFQLDEPEVVEVFADSLICRLIG